MPDPVAKTVAACAAGTIPPNVALMRLCIETPDPDALRDAIEVTADEMLSLSSEERRSLGRLVTLYRGHPDIWSLVRGTLSLVDHSEPRSVEQVAAEFDAAATASPAASSALYALGDPVLLAATTAEVVEVLRRWKVLGSDRVLLDFGCGSGRLSAALASQATVVVGVDISMAMLAAARRSVGASGVFLVRTSGKDLAAFRDAAFHGIIAADSFPYLFQAGGGLVHHHLREAHRVLKPNGFLAIFNLSYRGDLSRDHADLATLAGQFGFSIARDGERPFALWDAPAFLLIKPSATAAPPMHR